MYIYFRKCITLSNHKNCISLQQHKLPLLRLFLIVKLLYNSTCTSICPSYRGIMIFSVSIQDKCLKFSAKIPLTNQYLFYNNFVRLSVASILMDVLLLVWITTFIYLLLWTQCWYNLQKWMYVTMVERLSKLMCLLMPVFILAMTNAIHNSFHYYPPIHISGFLHTKSKIIKNAGIKIDFYLIFVNITISMSSEAVRISKNRFRGNKKS